MRAARFMLAFALALEISAASGCSMRYAFEQWPPYSYRDAAGQLRGMDVELTQAIFKEADCKLVLEDALPALRRERLFKDGQIDLLMAASDTPERRLIARFSVPYRHEAVRLFTTPAKLARVLPLHDFEAVRHSRTPLLAPNAGWYGPDYALALPGLKAEKLLSTFGNFDQGLRMLAAGRADLILGDSAAVEYAAHEAGIEIAALPWLVMIAPVHLMFNRASTSAEDQQRIDAAILRLEKRGTLAAIRAAYSEHERGKPGAEH